MTIETCKLHALNKLNELQYVYTKYNFKYVRKVTYWTDSVKEEQWHSLIEIFKSLQMNTQ